VTVLLAGLTFDEVVEERPQLAIGLAEAAARRGYDVIAAVTVSS